MLRKFLPSPELAGRLEQVAEQNNGMVPLHGRLFAQWLHHAYPRECPYPHLTGKTNPMTADQWMQAKGHGVAASKEEMRRFVNAKPSEAPAQPLPWSHEEELVAKHKVSSSQGSFRKVLWFLAAFGIVGEMLRRSFLVGKKTKEMILPCVGAMNSGRSTTGVHKQHMC